MHRFRCLLLRMTNLFSFYFSPELSESLTEHKQNVPNAVVGGSDLFSAQMVYELVNPPVWRSLTAALR